MSWDKGSVRLESVTPTNLEGMACFCCLFYFAGSRKPNSDGSPVTGGPALHLTSHHTLHEMTHSCRFLQMLSQLWCTTTQCISTLAHTNTIQNVCICISHVSVLMFWCCFVLLVLHWKVSGLVSPERQLRCVVLNILHMFVRRRHIYTLQARVQLGPV